MQKLVNSLQIDILKRHLGPLLFSFFTVMFLLLMQFLMNHLEKLVGKGIPLGIIVELILTNLAYMVVLAMPMSVLVATLMAFGKFSEMNEYTAFKAAGLNPIRVILPVLSASFLLCAFLIWFSDQVLPDANQKARSLFIDIRLKEPGFDLKPNVFYKGINGYVFLVKDIDSETDSLYNVTLFQEKKRDREEAVIKADKGYLRSDSDHAITLLLHNGTITQYLDTSDPDEKIVERTRFDRYRISFDISEMEFSRSKSDKRRRNDRTMTSKAMMALVDTLDNEINERQNQASKIMQRVQPKVPLNDSVQIQQPDPDTLKTSSLPLKPNTPVLKISHPSAQVDSVSNEIDTLAVFATFDENYNRSILVRAQSGIRSLKSNYENIKVKVDWNKKRIAQYMVEVHKKYSIPAACIIFVLIGAPLGLLTRNGNIGFAAIISTLLLTFYWVSVIQGEKLADRLFISPFAGMWFANIVLTVIGLTLLIHICTPYKINRLWN